MEFMVREARPEDAAAMLRFAEALFAEPGLDLPTAPGEFHLTLAEEEGVIAAHAAAPNGVFLLAVSREGEILGLLNCTGSTRRALRHSCEMGISVARAVRGQGVGQALLTSMLDWARGAGVSRIELHVYARNRGAMRLYRRFGFAEEGRRRQAIWQDGQYLDDIVMARLL